MGLMRRIVRAVGAPFRALRRRRADAGSVHSRSLPRTAALYAGAARTLVAPWWRKLVRWTVVITGFAVFAAMQYGMAFLINRWWWWFIVAFFVIVGSIALASYKPILVFVAWLVISPFGRHFLYMDLGWHAFPALTFDFIAIYFLAAVLIFRALADRKPVGKLVFGEWLLLAFVLYVAVMQAVSPEHTTFMDVVRTMSRTLIPEVLILAVVYFVTKGVIQSKEHVALVLKSMIVFGFLMALVNFYEHFTGNRWYSLVVGIGIPLAWQGIAQGRATGMFDSAAAPSTLISTIMFLTYHLAGWAKRAAARWLHCGLVVLMAVGAFFTYTRNVYVIMVLFTVLMAVLGVAKRARFVALAAVVFLVIAGLAPVLMKDTAFYDRMTNRSNAEDRVVFGRMTLNVIRHNFWFGVGWGKVNEVQQEYVTEMRQLAGQPNPSGLRKTHISHNTYLSVVAENGIVGSLFYFGAIAAFLVKLIRIRRVTPRDGFLGRDLVSILLVSSICFLASIQTIDILNIPYVHWMLWIQFALVVRLDELNRQESKERAAEPAGQLTAVRAAAG